MPAPSPPPAVPVAPLDVVPLAHGSGARAYVVIEPVSREALVVDPILDEVGEVLKTLASRRATVRFVVDTHLHGDHLSGAALLAERTGAEVAMGAATDVRTVTRRVEEGDVLRLGDGGLVVRAAPGLSPESVVLQGPGMLFTGDTLLVGTIGVRDVVGADGAPVDDGAALYDTIQRIFEPLPDGTVVYPGHDDMGRVRTTIKAEKRGNRWMREKDRDTFLARWGSDPRPVAKHAGEIAAANRAGTTTASPALAPVTTVGQPAKGAGPVVAPQGMGASGAPPHGGMGAPRGSSVPTSLSGGLADVALLAGAVVVAACALGFLVHPLFHVVSGAVGLLAVVLGAARASRRGRRPADGFFYTGPQSKAQRR